MVFYLKYRPQKIKDLDSEEVREKLSKVLSAKTITHAFLFTGPKGLGKTSAARIVAKSLNCTKKKTRSTRSGQAGDGEPCGKCETCVSITQGSNLDVLEIDAASNRGIDEIRDLREKIRLSPASADKKVYIIDEVHMLTSEAFNALLKTLEEPPAHAVFILCTTEPHKIPSTIISRCLHIPFRAPKTSELTRSFARIAKGEKMNIDTEGLITLTKISDGSFRDGAKLMEDLYLNFGKKNIGSGVIQKSFNVSSIDKSMEAILQTIHEKDIRKGLSEITKITDEGIDVKNFLESLLAFLNSLLLVKFGIKTNSSDRASEFLSQVPFETEDLKRIIEEISMAHSKLRYSFIPQIPLEIALINLSQDKSVVLEKPDLGQIKQKSEQKGEKINDKLINKINKENRSIAAILRGFKIEEGQGELSLSTGYKFHKERLDNPKTISIIERAYEEITGKKRKVQISLK